MNREELVKVAKPILFNTEMVQAILEGRKTCTRRAIKIDLGLADTDKNDSSYLKIPDEYGDYHDAKDLCRYKVGDILYVRETFRYVSIGEVDYFGECLWDDEVIQFKASQDEFNEEYGDFNGEYHEWKPSIHMPKELARIFLKVTDVRVERLQDITEEQAIKEVFISTARATDDGSDYTGLYAREEFIKAILKMYPECTEKSWMWIIEFERVIVE